MGTTSHTEGGKRRSARGRALRLFIASIFYMAATSIFAQPYIPSNDAIVLEHLPSATALKSLAPLRRQLADKPQDLDTALKLAKQFIDLGRTQADPRFLGYAEAALGPWLKSPNPPASVLVLEATVLQSRHQFDESLQMLTRATKIDPHNSQAWLTRATILRVQGRYPEARDACAQLAESSDQVFTIICLTGVNALNGRLPMSYEQLQRISTLEDGAPPIIHGWVLTELGEMAERMGDRGAAEADYRKALALTPDDIYLRAAYADLLLDEGRDADVVALLKNYELQDVLLMRLAIAGARGKMPDAARWADMFNARFKAAQQDGTTTHMREESRFLLEVQPDPSVAADLALRNWHVQHEPADVRLLLEAAAAAHEPALATTALDWINQTHLQDARLMPLAAAARGHS